MSATAGTGQTAQSSPLKEAPRTLEELRSQGGPPASSKEVNWEERRKKQQKENLHKISTEISKTAVGSAI